jgi:hypothetical protein
VEKLFRLRKIRDLDILNSISKEIKEVHELGVQIAIVIKYISRDCCCSGWNGQVHGRLYGYASYGDKCTCTSDF